MKGSKLYLIPTLLGNDDWERSIPKYNVQLIEKMNLFVVENEKSARKFIKTILPSKVQAELEIHLLDKHTSDEELNELKKLFSRNEPIGILSEAGMPSVADPGARLVRLAHQNGIQVCPLIGPSSIFLALAGSGLNGQKFIFHGYLPIDKEDRKKAISKLESDSRKNSCTQIFMETPYRNNSLLDDLLKFCQPSTSVCIAADLTMETEFILTKTIAEWRKKKTDLYKKPAIFLIES